MLVPMSDLADIADKLTRNEVLSSNEMRSIIGFKPDPKPESDELRNKNLNRQPGIGELPVSEDESAKGGIPIDEETA